MFSGIACPSCLISTWKWLATKNTRGCILSRQHILAFISIVFLFLFFWNLGYLPAVLVYGLKLDQGGFPVAARKGDVNPNYITYCRSIISSCKVSAIVQQVVICKSIYILSSEALWTSFSEGCTCCTILAQGDDESRDSWELRSNKGGTLMFNKKDLIFYGSPDSITKVVHGPWVL